MVEVISEFQGSYRFLSNFWPCPVFVGELEFRSAEHAYQYLKTDSSEHKQQISMAMTAGDAKKIGNSCPLRADWFQLRVPIMSIIVLAKFVQNPDLARKLLDTEDLILIEGNRWHDRFWGVCSCGTCISGKNHLGKILMQVRSQLTRFCRNLSADFDDTKVRT